MKPCCKNCHFLAKDHIWPNGEVRSGSWSTEERENLRLAVEEDHRARCYKNVWNTGIDPTLKDRLGEVLLKDRKDDCFFIEEHPGMSFQAAYELFRIRNDNRQLKRSYRLTQIGLWIAALALVANVVMKLLEKQGDSSVSVVRSWCGGLRWWGL